MEEKNEYKNNVILSLFWKLLERGGTQGIQFLIQIVLARILLPEDYGAIALVTILITLANVFVQSGFNTALIQKKNSDSLDFSSVFYFSVVFSIILYFVIYLSAPGISKFYNVGDLTNVIRVTGLTLIFGSINSIQNAVISKTMRFKKLFVSSLGAMVISGTLGIIFAFLGYGIWALVVQQLTNQISISIILWFTVKWRPTREFSFFRLKGLFSYGWKILVSSLIDTLYANIRSLFIGRVYTPEQLGFYTRGDQFPALLVTNINGSIQSVMLPVLSKEQDDKKKVKQLVRRSIVTSSYLLFPMMVGLAIVSKPLIILLLTDKWLPAVVFVQIACFTYSLWPIHTANLQAINALGRSDIFLKIEIIKKSIGIFILLFTLRYGVVAIALGGGVTGIISTFVNAFPNKKLLNYSFREQWKDIIPSLFLSILMGISIYPLKFIIFNNFLLLLAQITLGTIVYIALSKIFKIETYNYLKNTLISIKKGR
ncbi:lipopolysaccharide biosynthesis protein [Vagococcus carniphilus]|uniref:Lipopolysaccharide biosynthesis protein n=1 Tax=Vagococcus carniphilus TaxID=218144 RepID=A0AAW8U989_9ENTE|nr:lipopolysaccharide biosynthesis protein [Vagococcus carniphilus]MDT2833545.1 lipopolysaccharide biosynthesis protein [Vagococcus carniphilus]